MAYCCVRYWGVFSVVQSSRHAVLWGTQGHAQQFWARRTLELTEVLLILVLARYWYTASVLNALLLNQGSRPVK